MSAHQLRRQTDVERLRALAAASGGRLVLLDAAPAGGTPIRLEVRCRTAGSADYPGRVVDHVRLRINLPARYPFERPQVAIESPIFHPNVFPSGIVCQGDRWIAAEGLDLLVQRMIRLATFDPAHVNPASPANRLAASWYQRQVSRTPAAFPTDRVPFDAASGQESGAAARAGPSAEGRGGPPPQAADRVVRECPHCHQALRLPAGRDGVVACPRCRRDFAVRT